MKMRISRLCAVIDNDKMRISDATDRKKRPAHRLDGKTTEHRRQHPTCDDGQHPTSTATMATTAARQGRGSTAATAEAAGEAEAAETPSRRGRRRSEASPGPGASDSARRETQRRTEGLDSALGVVRQLSAAQDELFGFRSRNQSFDQPVQREPAMGILT